MYNEEELKKKIVGHLSESEMKRIDDGLLDALIKDVDEFNKNAEDGDSKLTEIYIDFDNVGTNSEGDPYETFSVKIKKNEDEYGSNIIDGLSLSSLDDVLCALCCYKEEKQELMKPINEKLIQQNKVLLDRINEETKNGNIVYKEMDNIMGTSFINFTSQGVDGQLYDLNRMPEVILSFQNDDWSKYTQRWINDLALVNLLKYYANRCNDLQIKLNLAENKLIEKDIMK